MALKPRTLVLGAVGLLTAGALAFVAFRTEPVPVDLSAVQSAPMQVTVDADGKTRIAELYEVAAPIGGIAQRAPVRVGDAVVAGETVVAVVEPSEAGLLDPRSRAEAEATVRGAEAGLFQARSLVRQAEEELDYAKNQYERSKALVERGVASLTRLEDAEQQLHIREAALEAAQSGLEIAMGTLDRARAALSEPAASRNGTDDACCVRLTAPADGVVLSIDMISERPVTAGTRLLTVGQPSDLEIVADLLSTDAVGLAPGTRALVDRWGGPAVLEARLARVEPQARTRISALGIEEQRVDVVFDLITPAEDRPGLGDGFAVFLRIVAWEADAVLQVPLSALFRRGDGWAVFRAEQGIAEEVAVTLGRRNQRTAQVLDGLSPGDAVITHPSDAIADGSPVVDRATLAAP